MCFCTAAGCAGPRWALDDPSYARKYGEPSEDESLVETAKASIDARFLKDHGGLTLGGMMRTNPDGFGGEIGLSYYPKSWLSYELSYAALGGDFAGDVFTGVNLGVRVQTPSRLAPFAGVGFFAGYSKETKHATSNGIDDDDDGFIDERGEEREEINGALAAFYPEVGVHFWLSSKVCLTGNARYYVTTQGRDHDNWLFGISLTYLLGD